MTETIAIERVDHIGIRVRELERALAFYRVLGFTLAHRAQGDDVAIVRNEYGVELNLIFNANAGDPAANVLMDVPDKFEGYTHMALRVASIPATIAALRESDIAITQGPVSFGESGQVSVFVRDPESQRDRIAWPRTGRGARGHPVRAVTTPTLPNSHALLRRDPLPSDFAVFLGFAGPSRRRNKDHALAFKTHPAHLIAANPARV